MKLYATTTSERASKGQGGNDFVETVYQIGDAKAPMLIGKTVLTKERYGYLFLVRIAGEQVIQYQIGESGQLLDKGNKQKGE